MSGILTDCIRDGTFPDSDDLLSQNATPDGISSLLASIAISKNELRDEIRNVSHNAAGDVDEWIAQAKKLQDDIARCKIEARHIVDEHERGQSLRNTVKDARSKVQLLETELAFTKALEHEIQSTSEITQALNEAERDLSNEDPVSAVGKLAPVETAIKNISASRTQSLLSQLAFDLRENSRERLVRLLDLRWTLTRTDTTTTLAVRSDANPQQPLSTGATNVTTESALSALQLLEALPSATALISRIWESFFISSMLPTSTPYPSSATEDGANLVISKNEDTKDPHKGLAILQAILQFLHSKVPEQIRSNVAHELLPKIIASFISAWLDSALPHDVHDLEHLEPLQKNVASVATLIRSYSWPGDEALNDWIEQLPRGWLAKRRVASLDAVRNAFSQARGTLRPVERIERQTVAFDEPKASIGENEEDWSANWDDEPLRPGQSSKRNIDDEDVSGWDFDTDDNRSDSGKKREASENTNDEDASGDAWGWGDEENTKDDSQVIEVPQQLKGHQANGEATNVSKVQEMVLTEIYHVTDIPDYILEIIGRDIADAHELQTSASKYFGTTSPATGLAGLPNLILALFRATAPTYYSLPSANYALSNINLYNDTLYIIQKLVATPNSTILESSIQSLSKFARQVYSSELDTQRTILNDLLDGAQGFDRCTTYPNSQACTDAVSSTVDRLRQLRKDWSSILGESHLLQSLGSLMTMIFGKIIKDIEDMDDISEAESKQLGVYSQQILSLEDLFASKLPNLTSGARATSAHSEAQQPETPSSQILLYVPNYLRFQYLQQILESSLVDIKYLWTEGELSLEFSVEEVIDLIKALFAESQYRRDAIRAIRGSAAHERA